MGRRKKIISEPISISEEESGKLDLEQKEEELPVEDSSEKSKNLDLKKIPSRFHKYIK